MQLNEFPNLQQLSDSDLLVVQEASTLILKSVRASVVKQYIGVSGSGGGSSNIRDEILKDNPVNYWQFDETSGTTGIDLGSAKQDGTYTGVILGQPSLANGSLYSAKFVDANSAFNFSNTIFDSNSDITFELVIKISSLNINGLFIGLGVGYEIGLGIGGGGDTGSPGNILVGIAGYVVWRSSYKSIGLGTHHIVMNYKGIGNKEWLFYIDGFLVNTIAGGTINTPNSAGFLKGLGNGELIFDEVAIYNKSLSANRILNHANAVIY